MGEHRILLVEDDIGFARFMTSYLDKEGFAVEHAENAADMFKMVDGGSSYVCFVVDLGLPDEDGIVLVRKLRARLNTPIIVLTGREQIEDKLACFEVGADDYVTKPVDPREMVMRLRAVMSRSGASSASGPDIIWLGDYTLDRTKHEIRNNAGDVLEFTPAEFALIWVIAQADGEVLSRDTLVDAVSSGDGPASFRAVDILVSRVRKKLAKDAIKTVSGAGYKSGWPASTAGPVQDS